MTTDDELVERLREAFKRCRYEGDGPYNPDGDLFDAAADRISLLREALGDLADAEKAYRLTHDTQGEGNRLTGRAWDLMRRAGDRARQALASSGGGG